jgi:hypothetical protein
LLAAAAAVRVREPAAHGTRYVLTEIMSTTPLRHLAWPKRWYRPAGESEPVLLRLPRAVESEIASAGNRAA